MGPCNFISCAAMGLRQVSDLSDYTIPELLRLIRLATAVLKRKLSGEERDQAAGWSDSESGISVIEPGASAASSAPPAQPQRTGYQGGSASRSAHATDHCPPPPRPLRNPWTCEFHCKYCGIQCCRPDPHKNHACVSHRHLR